MDDFKVVGVGLYEESESGKVLVKLGMECPFCDFKKKLGEQDCREEMEKHLNEEHSHVEHAYLIGMKRIWNIVIVYNDKNGGFYYIAQVR